MGSFAGSRVARGFGIGPRAAAVGLIAAALVAGAVWSVRGPGGALEEGADLAPLEATSAAGTFPAREYPAISPDDVWPERPPFAVVRGFPPPPPPPPIIPSGPVRRFGLARFEVDAAIEPLYVTATNEMPTPTDASYRVGWYVDFGQPGQGGNAVFSAHETWNHYQAPFFYLSRLETGDEVTIEMADGRRFGYAVISNVRYEVNAIPMESIVWPPARGTDEWITLITCGGRIVYDERTGFGEYLDRDVVVARRVR